MNKIVRQLAEKARITYWSQDGLGGPARILNLAVVKNEETS